MAAVDYPCLFERAECPDESLAAEDASVCGATSKLVGIARLAAEGENVRHGHNVEYYSLEARSILNRCTSPRMPFAWTVNPFRGCEFACKYCYARYTHEFMEIRDNVEFERKIFIKQNVQWLLRHDLKHVKRGEEIAIGTATDPYQPAERHYETTRAILEEFSQHRGFKIGLVTKSDLILRDKELLRAISDHNELFVNLTITTLDTRLARILEPRAPRPDLRLKALRELRAAGVAAGVYCAPVVPGITDSPKALDELVYEVKRAGGLYIMASPLFLRPCSASVFLPFLEKEFPELVARYRERYASRTFVPKAYAQRIRDLMRKLRAKYDMRHDFNRSQQHITEERDTPAQMEMFYQLDPPSDEVKLRPRRRGC